MSSKTLVLSSLLAITCTFSACKSKFSESSPSTVEIQGLPLKERVQLKDKVDSRMSDVQNGAERAKKIIDMFRKIQNPKETLDVYTPIDFLIDINTELKGQIPENGANGKLTRSGRITLPFTQLSDECRKIEVLLESDLVPSSNSKSNAPTIADQLTYSVKTCSSEGKFLATIVATWDGPTIEFRLENENLSKLFNNMLSVENLKTSRCQFKKGTGDITESIRCTNLELRLSKSEAANVKSMNFENSGDIRFEAQADIFENQTKKATSSIHVLSSGEVKLQVTKFGQTTETASTTEIK